MCCLCTLITSDVSVVLSKPKNIKFLFDMRRVGGIVRTCLLFDGLGMSFL